MPNQFSPGGLGIGKGQRTSISALLSKSNPGKSGSKPVNLPLKNDAGGKLSSHPLVSPQGSSSRYQLPSTSGTPLLQQGGGRLGGNLISSRLVEKRGSASSSGSSSSSRQTSVDFSSVNSVPAAKSLRKRCNTEPISPYRKEDKGAFKFKPPPSGVGERERERERGREGERERGGGGRTGRIKEERGGDDSLVVIVLLPFKVVVMEGTCTAHYY